MSQGMAISGPAVARASPRNRLCGLRSSAKNAWVLVLVLAVFIIPSSALAYTIGAIQRQLYNNEEFFQVINSEASEFTLRDYDGRVVHLDDFKGKVVVLNFLDGHCTDLCPLLSDLLAKIQGMIDRTPLRRQVQFVSISINPTKDTLPFMKKYGRTHGFDPRNWVFLTTLPGQPENATRKLALGYGQEFTEVNDSDFLHGLVTNVIDPKGMLRGKFHGLEFVPANLIAFVDALANDVGKPNGGEDKQQPLALVSDQPPPEAAPKEYPGLAIPAAAFVLSMMWLVAASTFFVLRRRRTASSRRENINDGSTVDGNTTKASR